MVLNDPKDPDLSKLAIFLRTAGSGPLPLEGQMTLRVRKSLDTL